ncbi:MAG: imidazole glycerol phosphate synthase subunit HisH [Eubacteriales bacterium]|nr:imidazole glycerol phosphate synthase subunit HisH [Eubacteriales bacterium]
MNVAIIKYNAGNIRSVDNALQRIGIHATITNDLTALQQADKVIFPGVGEAATTFQHLQAHGLDTCIKELKQPVLGICLGMQLMCAHSEEGDTAGLSIFDVEVKRFISQVKSDKIPHIGWNQLHDLKGPLFKGIEEDAFVYFVHSFYVPCNTYSSANATYIHPFCAALQKDNFYATQFHPEKSGDIGERILKNFIEL